MTAASTIKTWYLVHKWTSLVCTIFLLIICLTGLPLVFHHEIEHWLDDGKPVSNVPASTPPANLDKLVDSARAMYPGEVVDYLFFDPDEPQVFVGMAKKPGDGQVSGHAVRMDARTGDVLLDGPLYTEDKFSFMGIMLALHVDLFAGLTGELFLGFMGLLFCVAIVSGVVLYGPFMKKLEFGTVRATRSTRLKWLDLHNLLGIVTLVWAFVVGFTGVINELSTPLFRLWQSTEVARILEPYKGQSVPTELASAQLAADTAKKALPGNEVSFISFPGNAFGSPHHYIAWMRGDSPLTSKLNTPVLVDGKTGELTTVARMPWYLTALEVSRPLHFGDYGGLPLKIIWVLLDLVTIVVLVSGLYLWVARRRATEARINELVKKHQAAAAPQRTPA
ncbi:PepSY-associated TM helix domain-containing protein [Achromobacter deleyi]|uniref:PepSY-associated TM helix domain-containing protein n=1 Tax=Achromobacter deleyi TaxID=1353891 RepID=UPI0014921CCB|nr:PepSY-associated TM helix domain-containing protein [Achromobacter deleyi]QVQ29042.1 PepSY domain-containing protein [Achromobacter deleyi]UIP19160.1 PepSY domain-containing protein [Achromobacter deleyi]